MYSSQPSNPLRGTLPATQQVQPGNVAAAPQHLPGVPGGVAPGVIGVLPQTQQNQQDMLHGLPRGILDGLNVIRAKQQRVLALRQQAAQLEAEVQQDTEKLLLQYHAVQQQEAGLQQQDLNRLQTRCAGLEQDHGQLQREHGQLQYDLGQLEEKQGVLVQEKASLQLQLGQMQQQQGQQRRLQYSQTQQMPQGLQQQIQQPAQQLLQPQVQLPMQTQHRQVYQPPQMQQPAQTQQHFQAQQPIQQQPLQLQPPFQAQQPLQAQQTLPMQRPFQAQQPVHAQQLLHARHPPQVQQPIQQQFFHPQQQLAQQYAQQPQLPPQFAYPQYAGQTYQVPRYSAQERSLLPDTSSQVDWRTNTQDAYGHDVYELSDDEPFYAGQLQGLSSQMVPGGASKRARGDEGTDDDVSATGSRKRQKTATSDVRPAWLQKALSRGPASAADAIDDLDGFNSGDSNRLLKRGMTEEKLIEYIQLLEGWVELVASRGGDAMPVMIFGFDQLARKWNSAYTNTNMLNDSALLIPKHVLRPDTPESFRALWLIVPERFDSSVEGAGGRYNVWKKFRREPHFADDTVVNELASAKLPTPAQPDADATQTDASTVTRFEKVLRSLPFKWGESCKRLGEQLPPARATAVATAAANAAAGMNTTTTTTTTTTANYDNENDNNSDSDSDSDSDSNGNGNGNGNDTN